MLDVKRRTEGEAALSSGKTRMEAIIYGTFDARSGENRVLQELGRHSLKLATIDYADHATLIATGDTPEFVYFPHRGAVISLTREGQSGATVEVGVVGFEGMVPVQEVLSPGQTASDAVIQVAGRISHAPIADVRRLLDDAGSREILLAAAARFLSQISQHVICNRLHSLAERLAKWLLTVHDRIESDTMDLTHAFLAQMLGVRRAGVTEAVGELTAAGLITHKRNGITIIDRPGLEDRTCECYEQSGVEIEAADVG